MNPKFRVLHNESTEATDGQTIFVAGTDEAAITVSGTSTNFQLTFQVSIDGVIWVDTIAYKTADPTTSATSTNVMNEGWDFDVARWNYLRCTLDTIANGNVTVLCSIVDLN